MKDLKILPAIAFLAFAHSFAQEPEPVVEQVPAPSLETPASGTPAPPEATTPATVPVAAVPAQPQPQAQSSETVSQKQEDSGPKNTITVDIGPTIIGVGVGIAGNILSDDIDASGFGIALQYERQIFERLSVAGRFAYLGLGIGAEKDDAKLETGLSSFSIESHIRTYPFGGSFFLDGVFGYANMSADFSGKVEVKYDYGPNQTDTKEKEEDADFELSRSYLKYGVKLGWRVDFGEPGGFIFEHGFGYYFGTKFGKTIPKQFAGKFAGDADVSGFDDAIEVLEDFVFIGGPRYTFAFGWRF